jgi:class 3 adenylate cyclase
MDPPPTRYAHSGDAMIAYQTVGDGPIDLFVTGGPASHLELLWEEPSTARSLQRIASFSRLILADRRGTGLSDPVDRPPTLEQQMDDLRAVLDAAGVRRTALFGLSDAGLCAMFAATYPDRVTALALCNVAAKMGHVFPPELVEDILEMIENRWGEGGLLPVFAPSHAGDARFERWWARFQRAAASPGMARRILDLNLHSDVSAILPTIRAPTLVLHRTSDQLVPIEHGRAVAALIPNARFVEVPGTDNYAWADEPDAMLDEVEEFLTGRRRPQAADRVLATVLFTDICGSTARAAELGDREWRELLDRHNTAVRAELERWRGNEVKTTGDGFLATFDGPARAVRCADAIRAAVSRLGLEVRAGVHTGECELLNGDVGGIAVHVGARVTDLAGPGEVVVSSTVKELVVGSGLEFANRGNHDLRGVPGEWHLFSLS